MGTVRSMSIVVDTTGYIKDPTEALRMQTNKLEGINVNISKKAEQINDLVTEAVASLQALTASAA